MTSQGDPPRLEDTEGLPASLASALGSARAVRPDSAELAAVKRGVFGAVGLVPGQGPAPSATAPLVAGGAGSVAGAKAVAGTKGVLAVALPWFGAPIGVAVVASAVALGVAGGRRAPAVPAHPATVVVGAHRNVAPAAPDTPTMNTPSPENFPPSPDVAPGSRSATRDRAVARAPSALSARVQEPVPAANPVAPLTSTPESELSLVARAQAALAADPARALSLTDEHLQRFGSGALAQEREVIAIGALVRLGRMTEARARAERFHALYPTSAHGRRVDVLLERF